MAAKKAAQREKQARELCKPLFDREVRRIDIPGTDIVIVVIGHDDDCLFEHDMYAQCVVSTEKLDRVFDNYANRSKHLEYFRFVKVIGNPNFVTVDDNEEVVKVVKAALKKATTK